MARISLGIESTTDGELSHSFSFDESVNVAVLD